MRKIFQSLLVSIFVFSLFCCTSVPKSETAITFHDYFKGKVTFEPNQNVAKNPYNKENFIHHWQDYYYEDEIYTSRMGVDISRHDGEIDWKKLKNSGRDFVFLRAAWRGYETGIMHVDENFHQNIVGALDAGFDVGVYVFSQATNEKEALEEAEFILNEIKDYKITLPVVFDPEHIYKDSGRSDDVTGEQFTKNAIVFCERVKQAGYEPMIYANLSWQAFVLDLEQLQDYKMWYADYQKVPRTPYDFEFWQYSAWGDLPGTNTICDLDLWIIKK